MPVFFIAGAPIRARRITITGPLHHHLRTSLRHRVGDELWIGDHHRKRFRVKITRIDARELTGEVLEEVSGPMSAGRELVLGQALLKGERMDWVIQKATELGADRLVPLVTGHTVVRPRPGRVDAQQERWQRIALEAAQQSERWEVPAVATPCDAVEFFRTWVQGPNRFILVEPGASVDPPAEGLGSMTIGGQQSGPIVLAIGPEGGWRPEEVMAAVDSGFRRVTLGPRVLRAETATLATLAVVQSRLGSLG